MPIDGPHAAWEWLKPLFVGASEERLGALFLDRRNRVRARRVITVGTPSFTLVDPGQIFRLALSVEAHALVLGHNHPSGDPTPSREDLAVTRRVREAGTLLGIALVDHLVLGANCYTSLAEEGAISR